MEVSQGGRCAIDPDGLFCVFLDMWEALFTSDNNIRFGGQF